MIEEILKLETAKGSDVVFLRTSVDAPVSGIVKLREQLKRLRDDNPDLPTILVLPYWVELVNVVKINHEGDKA